MKWEEYVSLSQEEREEYDYRFKGREPGKFPYFSSAVVIGFLFFMSFLMSAALLLTAFHVPSMEPYQDMLVAGFVRAVNLFGLITFLVVIDIFSWVGSTLWFHYKERQWRKART